MSAPDLGASIASARRALARAFRLGGLDSPDPDARLLIEHALALDHAGLISAQERALTSAERERIAALARRRLSGEPVARIRGSKEFWGLDLEVTEAVLVPRPETETLVETALALIRPDGARPLRIADLGTGSGALLIALLHEWPAAHGIATDRSLAALAVARRNAVRHGVAARAAFVACDFGAALAGGFDLVVSNPPYIPHGEIAGLAPEVRDFDPMLALDGGADGLDAYRAITADAARLLRPGGTLIVEVGHGQAGAVNALVTANALTALPTRPDLAGIPRAVVARHEPGP